jgi:hypothetical protein
MNDLTANVLALEALVLALVKTHPDTNKLKFEFAQMYQPVVKDVNQTDADHPGLGKKLMAECSRLAHRIP